MNAHSLYAFYGSLRRGMSNHALYRAALKYRFSVRLKGFKLYALEHYPFAVRTGRNTDSVAAEIFQVTDPKAEQSIHELELSVGYFYDEVLIDQKKVGIYLYARPENYPEVFGGDWVKFFGTR